MAQTAQALQHESARLERDHQVEQYLWLVRQIAAKLMKNLHGVEFDDLVGDGVFGLMRAIEFFDPARGVKFETYATSVIRGAMLNGLRALDWMPERKRARARDLKKAIDAFQLANGREGTEEELARELEMSAREVYELIADLGTQYLLSLDQPVASGPDDDRTVLDTLEDRSTREPAEELQFAQERLSLLDSIENLPDREKTVIRLHYGQRKNFEEIAEVLAVSKQRISQLHGKAVKLLRRSLCNGEDGAVTTLLGGSFNLFD